MDSRKTLIRFFTIADYEEEEIWLREQHKSGWRLVKMTPPCFYIFEKCAPEDVVYRLDYKNNSETGDYFQLFSDYGWEYIGRCVGWLYFRKPVSEQGSRLDSEIFSDNESRLDMLSHIIKTRLLPILVIFLCCVIPNFSRSMSLPDAKGTVFTILFSVLMLLYIYLLAHCCLKLRRLREKYKKD